MRSSARERELRVLCSRTRNRHTVGTVRSISGQMFLDIEVAVSHRDGTRGHRRQFTVALDSKGSPIETVTNDMAFGAWDAWCDACQLRLPFAPHKVIESFKLGKKSVVLVALGAHIDPLGVLRRAAGRKNV